jgi:hypothetical protein
MYKTFICTVSDGMRSARYGVSAGNELEVRNTVERELGKDRVIEEIREAKESETVELALAAGTMKRFW